MVMKVGNINSIQFRAQSNPIKTETSNSNMPQIKELSAITPDFAVRTPMRYSFLGKQQATNGLEIYSYKLANGHRVTIIPMKDSPAVVKNYVNVGSMNETDDIKGISHFLEHMAFNGTNGTEGYIKLDQGDSFKKIDELGGWTNASTNYAITDYVNSTQLLNKDDIKTQLQVIASMTEDLSLPKKMIEKEKGPVSSEINMILDNPQTIALDQTVRTLFNIKSSSDELVGGSVNHIQNLTQEKVKDYYNKYYTPDNMNLVVTGDIDPNETIETISKLFKSTKKPSDQFYEEKLDPINKTIRKDFISNKATSTDIILGFAGYAPKNTKDEILFQVVSNYLNSNQAGIKREMKKLNSSWDLASEKISTNPNKPSLIFFSARSSEENSEKVLKLIFDKLSSLKKPTEEELQKIKDKLLSSREDALEYSSYVNDIAGKGVLNGSLDTLTDYDNILNNITPDDVKEFMNKYLDINKTAVTLVHPQTSEENIKLNHKNASSISFKGSRKPLNTDNIDYKTLNNNYKCANIVSKSNNINFNLNLYYKLPENINPATLSVLNRIYKMGTNELNQNEFDKICEDNNLDLYLSLSSEKLTLEGSSGYKNKEELLNIGKELLLAPNISEETLQLAKSKIKDALSRHEDNTTDLYIDNEAKINPLYTATSDIEANIDKVTLEDVQKLHQYILENSSGTVSYNTPQAQPEFTDWMNSKLEALPSVKPDDIKRSNVFQENTKTQVLTKDRNVSQAEIMQTFKYKKSNDIKEEAISNIMNTILSSSASIGLFNTLREKEHLAYTVYSNLDSIGNSGELSLNILTTTDNKDIGEISYDNVQKSIDGFNRQINSLLNSEYTDSDLESAKNVLKTSLLSNEGTFSKLCSLDNGLSHNFGIDYENKIYDVIDSITREDIDNFAKQVFSTKPIYSIVASKDTLEANKEYLDNLISQ